jgi:uncharacterized protein YjbJ (UPF0337 family)
MNLDPFEGQWTRIQGEIASWWDRLANADLEKISGKRDALVGLVQETTKHLASSLAETAREIKTQAETAVSTAATAVGDTVARKVSSLQETSVKDVAGSLTDLIRRRPIPYLLIELGIGFVLSPIVDKPTAGQGA